jgi:hypothetical protein
MAVEKQDGRFKSLIQTIKEQRDKDARQRAKESSEVKSAILDQKQVQQDLLNQGFTAEESAYQARQLTIKALKESKEAIIKNNPVKGTVDAIGKLTSQVIGQRKDSLLQSLQSKLPFGNSGAKATEDKRDKMRMDQKILSTLGKVSSGIMGLGSTLGGFLKDKAKQIGGDIFGMLKKFAFGAAVAGVLVFLNSKYWEDTKAFVVDKLMPALKNLWLNVISPLVTVFKDVIVKQFEAVKALFDTLGDAIQKFKDGDILGGITTLVGGLGTFFKDTIDNLITGVYNLFAGLFGLEPTDSVFGSISTFISDTWKSIKTFFTNLYDGVVGLFTDPVGTLTTLWTGLVGEGGLIDILFAPIDSAIAWVQGIFGWGDPDEPFKISTFVKGIFGKVKEWFVGLFTWGKDAGTDAAGDFSLSTLISTAFGTIKEWFTGLFTWAKESGETEAGDFSLTKLATAAFGKVKEWIGNLFSWASEPSAADDEGQPFSFFGTLLEAVKAPIRFIQDLFTFDSEFFEKGLLGKLGIVSAKLVDLIFYPLNLGINFIKGLFGWDEDKDGNKTTFSLSGLIASAIEKIWNWFKGLLSIDVMSIVKGIPGASTLLSWFASDEQDKQLASAVETGFYNKDIVGASEIDESMMTSVSPEQLQAVLADNDLRESDKQLVIDELARRGIEQRASGGPVKAGGMYIVGEEGRELFVPKTAGMIVPNSSNASNKTNSISTASIQTQTASAAPIIVNAPTANVSDGGGGSRGMQLVPMSVGESDPVFRAVAANPF